MTFNFTVKDGTHLHIRHWPCQHPIQKTPVFGVHGLLRTGADFSWLADDLSLHHAFYAPDVRGRGKSGHSPYTTYTIDTYADDMIETLDHLGLEKVHWLGTSMGGLIGMVMALKHPERIKSLILNDIGPVLLNKGMRRIGNYVGVYPTFKTFEEGAHYIKQIYAPFKLDDAMIKTLAEDSLVQKEGIYSFHYAPSLADAFRLYLKETPHNDAEHWEDFRRIRCPMLVIRGETSDILTPEIVEKMRTQCSGHLQTYTEPHTGHAPMLHKPETKKVIKDFVNGIDGLN